MTGPSLFSLRGRTALVTGAAGLLGREHALALAEAGATVVAGDIDADACGRLAGTLPSPALGVRLDVTDPESIRSVGSLAEARFGRIDILVNNAAMNDRFEDPALSARLSMFEQYPLDMWKKVMEVNVTGVFLCCQVIGNRMAERGGGSIVNIASTYGIVAPDQSIYRSADGRQDFYKSPSYPASKAAVIALTRFLGAYWGGKGVRVNALSPGGVENGQERRFVDNYSARTPMGRMAKPGDLRGALVFLASEASAYMTGANLVVDGGWIAI
jgi:NAD(P)-dependent dehydrogenase (short-subunit alcohol dehydrogenase family)